jgi:hypothetical protein
MTEDMIIKKGVHMKREDFNFDGIKFQEGERVFTNEEKVKEFYNYLEEKTKDNFESFEVARRKSNYLATKKYIG